MIRKAKLTFHDLCYQPSRLCKILLSDLVSDDVLFFYCRFLSRHDDCFNYNFSRRFLSYLLNIDSELPFFEFKDTSIDSELRVFLLQVENLYGVVL